jgi:hypothetical protein
MHDDLVYLGAPFRIALGLETAQGNRYDRQRPALVRR